MEIIICDVGNAACSFVCSPNGYGMMIDCGCSPNKENPIDVIKRQIGGYDPWIPNYRPYITKSGIKYPLTLLHITHPDDDHVRNALEVKRRFEPYLLRRVHAEQFPDAEEINRNYIKEFDEEYRGTENEVVDWGFDSDKTFQIPIDIVKSDDNLKSKIRNNSSIVRYIKYKGIRILFTGDLEKKGWEWLAENNDDFQSTMQEGIDILIAPHHGHKSGFPKALLDLTGNVKVVILSKDSEANVDGTDVSSQYSNYADGVYYKNITDDKNYSGKVLSTRSNGNIYIKIPPEGIKNFTIWCDKASSNHVCIDDVN